MHEKPADNVSWRHVSDKAALQVAFCLPWFSTLFSDGFMIRSSLETLLLQASRNLLHVIMPTISLLLLRLFGH